MSEKIYALFLRLYPAAFRRVYGDDAMQLFRDRVRDETGLLPRIRLCLDLLIDFALGLHQALHNSRRIPVAAAGADYNPGVPSFRTLDRQPLRPGSFLFGCACSLAALGTFIFVLGHARRYQPFDGPDDHASPVESVVSRLNPDAAPSATTSQGNTVVKHGTAPPHSALPAVTAQQPPAQVLPADQRRRVINRVIAELKAHYVDPAKARAAAEALMKRQARGDYNAASNGPALASSLTSDIREATGDMHLIVVFSADPIPSPSGAAPSAIVLEEYRARLIRQNCDVSAARTLDGNVGYLKIDSFPEPSICHDQLESVMKRLNGSDALIVDLRDNRGGTPEMVAYIAAWLIDGPQAWYNPREDARNGSPQLAPVSESRLTNKPVYVLTSARTISAAEQFCYNLKMLHRVTIVGETTAGSAHIGAFHRVDDHFGIGIPETPISNPYAAPDWEGKGVAPDVAVPEAEALQTAEKLVVGSHVNIH